MSRGQKQVLYGLYSVVEHSGRLNSGHYVAYVRSRPLDPNRTNKQFLNLKPSSQFEINHLVTEMAEKIEASSGMLDNDLKGSSANTTSVNVEVSFFSFFHFDICLTCSKLEYYFLFIFSHISFLLPTWYHVKLRKLVKKRLSCNLIKTFSKITFVLSVMQGGI